MFCLNKPTIDQLEKMLELQSALTLSYSEVGLTRYGSHPASRYHIDRVEVKLGEGRQVFERACETMRNWQHLRIPGILLYPSEPAIAEGNNLIVSADHLLIWSCNACRIVYVINDTGDNYKRFGYGYGTLPEHSECGEERFLIQWNLESDLVTYDILAFSRANKLLVGMLWPVAVFIQDQFRSDSLKVMKKYVRVGQRQRRTRGDTTDYRSV